MWTQLAEVPGLWAADKRSSANWHWRATALPLAGGGALVISPLPDPGDDDVAHLEATVGVPAIALAPNHYHWMALPAWRERYPELPVVASSVAARRLRKKLGFDLGDLDAARERLPAGAELVEPPGLKNGEVWLRLEHGGRVAWIVSDAFFNVEEKTRGLFGFLLRITGTVPGLRIGRTFTFAAVGDKPGYRDWLLDRIAADRPAVLVPGHGNILTGDDLPERLDALVRARL